MLNRSSSEDYGAIGTDACPVSPDWPYVYKELRRPGVTAKLLWLQCRQRINYADSYQKFCRSYRQWLSRLNFRTRWYHVAGEKMYAGYIDIRDAYTVDTSTGETYPVYLFLAVLGASGYCYAEPCMSKDIDSWISGHIHAFEFFQGATGCLMSCLTESDVRLCEHIKYRELARRCYAKIRTIKASKALPLFSYNSRTSAFDLSARWLAKVMRHQYFIGFAEVNVAIQSLIKQFNIRPFKKLPGTPKEWFETLERHYLVPLPSMAADREFLLHQKVTGTDINIGQQCNSLPQNAKEQLVRTNVTAEYVEAFYQGRQITVRARSDRVDRAGAKLDRKSGSNNMSEKWTPQRVLNWAKKIGPATTYLTDTILSHANHSKAGVRSCLGLLTLQSEYGQERLESACRQAATGKSWTVANIRSLLKHNLDQATVQLAIPGIVIPTKPVAGKKKRCR